MRVLRLLIVLALAAGLLGVAGRGSAASTVRVLRVGSYHGITGQFNTIQDAVNAARPGDWVLVGPGDYHEHGSGEAGVLIPTPGIHVRGMDRNGVIVDGTSPLAPTACAPDASYQLPGRNGVEVYKASGVYVENLTVCNFLTGSDGGHGKPDLVERRRR